MIDWERYGALPASAVPDLPPDPGSVAMVWAGLKEGLLAPFGGLAERFGLLPSGTRMGIRDDFERIRDAYLSQNPSFGRAALSLASEALPQAVPIGLGGGTSGRLAGALLPRLSPLAGRAVIGAVEGGMLGLGETAGQGPLATGVGLGLGAGLGAVAGRLSRHSPELAEQLEAFGVEAGPKNWMRRNLTSSGPLGSRAKDMLERTAGRVAAEATAAQEAALTLHEAATAWSREAGLERWQVDSMVDQYLRTKDKKVRSFNWVDPTTMEPSAFHQIPDAVREAGNRVRSHVDALTSEYQGVLQEQVQRTTTTFSRQLRSRFAKAKPADLADFDMPFDPRRATPDDLEKYVRHHLQVGGTVESIRSELKPAAQAMRLVDVLEENKGSYLHRSYQFHSQGRKKYLKQLLSTDEGRARYERLEALLVEGQGLSPDEARGRLHALFDGNQSADVLFARSDVRGPDGRVLRRRKDISYEVRQVLGEIKNPYVNYAKTVNLLAGDLAHSRLLSEMREELLSSGMAMTERVGDHAYLIRGSRSKVPLAGSEVQGVEELYATKEVADLINGTFEALPRTYTQAFNAWTHLAKTGYSPFTHVRNFLANVFFLGAQGHTPLEPASLKLAWQASRYGATGRLPGGNLASLASAGMRRAGAALDIQQHEVRDIYQRLNRLGVVQSGTRQGDLEAFLKISHSELSGTSLPRNLFDKGNRFTLKAYQAEDDFWKLYSWKQEFRRARQFGMNEADALQYADGAVIDSFPIYSRIPEAVKKIRNLPLVGPFVSFPAEVVRVFGATTKRALREATSADPILRRIGRHRLGGMTVVTAIPLALTQTGRILSGTTEDEELSLRHVLPEWMQNSNLVIASRDEQANEYTAMDFSALDPFNYLRKPVVALMRSMNDPTRSGLQGAVDSVLEVADAFVGPELWLSEFWDFAKEVPKYDQMPAALLEKAAFRAYRAAAPGVVTTGERLLRASGMAPDLLPGTTTYGKKYRPAEEALAFLGRPYRISVGDAVGFRARDLASAYRQARAHYRDEARPEAERVPTRIFRAQEAAEGAWRDKVAEMHRVVFHARRLGMTDQQLTQQLQEARLSEEVVRSILAGDFPPLTLPEV